MNRTDSEGDRQSCRVQDLAGFHPPNPFPAAVAAAAHVDGHGVCAHVL